jgi:hypothetical protein
MNNILIIGDSYAADWTKKYPDVMGWPNMLAQKYNVINLAQAGVSEYKIYKQLCSIDNISKFDLILISHTSPYRINTRYHPIHYNDVLHKNADLIFSDIEYHKKSIFRWFNKSLTTAFNFFKYHNDDEYQETVYLLLKKQIADTIGKTNSIALTNTIVPEKFKIEKNFLDFSEMQLKHPGLVNHMSDIGNRLIYNAIVQKITTIKGDKE